MSAEDAEDEHFISMQVENNHPDRGLLLPSLDWTHPYHSSRLHMLLTRANPFDTGKMLRSETGWPLACRARAAHFLGGSTLVHRQEPTKVAEEPHCTNLAPSRAPQHYWGLFRC